MARRRPGYGIAVLIGVLASAWAHDFASWCYEVYPLFGIRASQPLAMVALEKIPEPPPPIALETLKYRAPAPPAPAKEGGALAKNDGLRLKKKSNRSDLRLLSILGALDDDKGAFAMLSSADASAIADVLTGEQGGVVGGVIGSGSGDAVGIGGLGLRGEGVGGGGTGMGLGGLGHGSGGGLAGLGDAKVGGSGSGYAVRGGGGHGATAIDISDGVKETSPLRSTWAQKVRAAVASRWSERMKSTGGEYHDSIRIVLRVIVDAEGNDATVEILRPSGIDAADAAALAAVREKSLPAPPVEILDIFGRASVVVSVVLRFD